jgi:hypothetical protein
MLDQGDGSNHSNSRTVKPRSPIDLREDDHGLLVRRLVRACPTTQREASPTLNIEAKGLVVGARMFNAN